MDGDEWEWVWGILLVGVYAYHRFNTPRRNRYSTTPRRFIRSAFFYIFAVELMYFVLVAILKITALGEEAIFTIFDYKNDNDSMSAVLLAALMFTTALPSIDKLSKIDEQLREFSWRVGHIPGMAYQLARRMRQARYETPEEFGAPLRRELGLGFPDHAVRQNSDGSLEHLWTITSSLIVAIKDWKNQDIIDKQSWSERDQRIWGELEIVDDRLADDYEELIMTFDRLKDRAAACFTATEMAGADDIAAQEYRNDFRELVVRLHRNISLYCARGLLICGDRGDKRRRLSERLGFRSVLVAIPERSPIHHLAATFLLLVTMLSISFAFFELFIPDSANGSGVGNLLKIVPLISMIYMVGICLALFPKGLNDTGENQQKGGFHGRPFGTYILSGLGAVGASVIITFIYRSILEGGDFRVALLAFFWTYPWLLTTFSFTIVVALLADNYRMRMAPRWFPVLEGGVLAAVLVAVNWMVHSLLEIQHDNGVANWMNLESAPASVGNKPPPLDRLIPISALLGLLVGGFVPHYYRKWIAVSAHDRLIKYIDRNRFELIEKLGNLESTDQVFHGLVSACAYVAAVDGAVDPVERERFAAILDELSCLNISEVSRDKMIERFNEKSEVIKNSLSSGEARDNIWGSEIETICHFKGRRNLGILLLRCCESMACSDRRIHAVEYDLIVKIVDTIDLERNEISIRPRRRLLQEG
ncbi:TerB family tellurite resistance protein [Marinobacter adhaerens]|uniref:TerB family tellurite resistance protein n=1 Tax=Marinobacter adhaerens TaxID=1033846 RepID=UPI003F70F93B